MLRKLTAVLSGVLVTVVVVSALAAPPKKKKKRHPPKPPAKTAPAPAPTGTANADPDLYKPPAETAPEPAPAPATPPAEAAPSDTSAAPADTGKEAEPSSAKEAPKPTVALPAFSIAALGGWGLEAAAGVGFGARAGYTLPFHVYLGATFIYHLGESENGAKGNFFYPGAEAGYDLLFGAIVLRPYVGAGPNFLHLSDATQTLTRLYPAVWPGVTAAYTISPNFFVGLDARYLLGGYSWFNIFGTVGARF